jgi:mRNA-degrading endonuclease toxin of MazEF toxin-antitoxin module
LKNGASDLAGAIFPMKRLDISLNAA